MTVVLLVASGVTHCMSFNAVDSQSQFKSPRITNSLGSSCRKSYSRAGAPATADGWRFHPTTVRVAPLGRFTLMAHSSKNLGFFIISTEQQSNPLACMATPSFIHTIRPKENIPIDVNHMVSN